VTAWQAVAEVVAVVGWLGLGVIGLEAARVVRAELRAPADVDDVEARP